MSNLLPLVLSVATLAVAAAAQCPFQSLSAQSLGPGCNTGFTGCCAVIAMTPTVLPELDTSNCELDVRVPGLEGCCGVVVPFRLLVLGSNPAMVPLPEFGPGCTLRVFPDVLLASTTDSFSIALPPLLPPVTVLAQAVYLSHFAAAPGDPNELVFTDAQVLRLQ